LFRALKENPADAGGLRRGWVRVRRGWEKPPDYGIVIEGSW
jgi:hypothetical protein